MRLRTAHIWERSAGCWSERSVYSDASFSCADSTASVWIFSSATAGSGQRAHHVEQARHERVAVEVAAATLALLGGGVDPAWSNRAHTGHTPVRGRVAGHRCLRAEGLGHTRCCTAGWPGPSCRGFHHIVPAARLDTSAKLWRPPQRPPVKSHRPALRPVPHHASDGPPQNDAAATGSADRSGCVGPGPAAPTALPSERWAGVGCHLRRRRPCCSHPIMHQGGEEEEGEAET